jgi:hypothetical protein
MNETKIEFSPKKSRRISQCIYMYIILGCSYLGHFSLILFLSMWIILLLYFRFLWAIVDIWHIWLDEKLVQCHFPEKETLISKFTAINNFAVEMEMQHTHCTDFYIRSLAGCYCFRFCNGALVRGDQIGRIIDLFCHLFTFGKFLITKLWASYFHGKCYALFFT